jgi:hypothetical protein
LVSVGAMRWGLPEPKPISTGSGIEKIAAGNG